MAIYKGREVTVTSAIPQGYMETQNVTITYQNGSTELVKLNSIQFTKSEKDKIQKDAGSKFDTIQVIEDKEYNEIIDSQDPDKIDMSKNPVATGQVMKTMEVDSKNRPLHVGKETEQEKKAKEDLKADKR